MRERFDLLLHQESSGGLLYISSDARRGCMRAVGCAKGVVDIYIAECRKLFCKLRIVFLFFGVKSEILEKENIAGR